MLEVEYSIFSYLTKYCHAMKELEVLNHTRNNLNNLSNLKVLNKQVERYDDHNL